ncbi:GNAT family N-acetyltransferase [Deinococcus rubellus]|uniref:GNAT family N-acetyltransferase n=1 Tax=Deinococcus rubellus TaxID=1889240 RepID=A0ABY5YGN7_9DEIO|nr:GNAT family N-acetyltransferase [Deinococcus rubellus]UWX63886.1 GNAT family N-acetyltransferase [Deinococcus rubellus]
MLRPCTSPDRPSCLNLLDRNLPHFFVEHERADFAAFLDRVDRLGTGSEPYFVLEREGEVVACGGVGPEAFPALACLSWGMVRGDLHGAGLGSEPTRSWLDWLRRHWPAVTHAKIETSHHTEGFYACFGFEVAERTLDGYGPGLDRVRMVARL